MNEAIIFIASQPRAGSTMLQRMFAAHPDVVTMSEPWIMLHPLYAMKRQGIATEFNSQWAAGAVEDFVSRLPGGREAYRRAMCDAYGGLYRTHLAAVGKRVFVDKTPRYFLVLPELRWLFPEAPIILLLRHPLAVLVSMIHTWARDDISRLEPHRVDLIQGPAKLAVAAEHGSDIVVRYEQLLANPEEELRRLCVACGVEYRGTMVAYGKARQAAWSMGDPVNAHRKEAIDPQHADAWRMRLRDPMVWSLCRDYWAMLGQETTTRLGYSWEAGWGLLNETKPRGTKRPGQLERLLGVRSYRGVTGGMRLFATRRREIGLGAAVMGAARRGRRTLFRAPVEPTAWS